MIKRYGLFLVLASLLLTSCGQTVDTNSEQPQEIVAKDPQAAPGNYITLAEFESEKSKYADFDVVLFFNAAWCSTCKVARDNIESNRSSIPENLTIVVVDYDSEIELRRKYGVVIQHTFVQINSSGKELTKWSGSVTATEIDEKLV